MKVLLTASTLSSMMFTQMNHPLAMGMMLLMQTTMMCLISGLMHQSFWFQYILFMVFIGGMLVLFIYVASLASNEMFSLSTKMMLLSTGMMMGAAMIKKWTTHNSSDSTAYNTTSNEIILMTSKLYNQPSGTLTILMALYLLMTLIVVVKITNVSKGPLRQST
uniref:NADH-ubiquinone oxidoreductase chain 6 n=1 Tax=Cryptotermes havilandi TaxID=641612 RepID=A0A7U3QS41_9NEOP|nr:NADH dehydrogenase subunit 6 [Cryptotermes havilandi]QPN53787.1 NADH dehydrogenase subunit 6 [Cryptotermes havilandi]URX52848.1 NADH dehydrogenase subunit 6 [Cryptotermes havilandi]URX52887.1 NADH dehydrogenase subunit 6 [Cryptotermes havilandi]